VASGSSYQLRIAHTARREIIQILRRSRREFGSDASLRYDALIQQALADVREDPMRPETRPRSDLAPDYRTYHLASSRKRARISAGVVRRPRHFLLYRVRDQVVEVLRVLHDARDLDQAVS
jgi:toxin ParE1/3/4